MGAGAGGGGGGMLGLKGGKGKGEEDHISYPDNMSSELLSV